MRRGLSVHDGDPGSVHQDDDWQRGNPRRPPVIKLVRAELVGDGHHVAVRLALREVDKA